jgi:Holliday junction resolvasome RuvABC endonuclease subunit
MILGLDLGTTVTGYCILNNIGEIVIFSHQKLTHKSCGENIYSKANCVREFLRDISSKYSIKYIFIEDAVKKFRPGLSSANTISIVTRFNGIISYLCYEIFGLVPIYITSRSARSSVGIKIPKKTDPKKSVIGFLLENEPRFEVKYNKNGGFATVSGDEADAIVMAKAGFKSIGEQKRELG